MAREPDGARHKMGVALQEAGLDPRQTGRELLVLQGRLFGMSAARPPRARTSCSTLVELEDAADRRIKGYSGGMKRRLDLASALVHEPEVLFLDEPTTGLDPASRLTVWDEVRRINELGTTVFLTTQYLEEADQLCDRLAIIDDGRIVREGTPAQLKAELRERPGLDHEPTLDDVFLDATGRTRARGRGRRAGGVGMSQAWVLGQRALREAWRTPDALIPTLFIPLFFLVVNVGQAGKIFPSASTEFLKGQGYGAFQLPTSLLLAASFGTAALFLVEEIEGGYFDKLRAAPIPRTAIVLGRLIAEFIKGAADLDRDRRCSALVFGITIASGVVGFLLLILLTALWAVVLRRLHAADRAEDPQRGGDQLRQPDLLPAAVPDAELRAARPADAADGDRRDAQPGHLRDGVAALADPRRPRLGARSGPGSRSSPSLGALMLALNVRRDQPLR